MIKQKLKRFFAGDDRGSSALFGAAGMLLWIGLFFVALHMKAALPAGVFLALFLFGAVTNFWAVLSARRITIDLSCLRPWVYPGQDVTLRYTVKNKKRMPLFWLEVNQNGQEMDAFVPDEGFERYHEAGTVDSSLYLRQNFAWILPRASVKADCVFHAKSRGIYQITHLSARTGDGFGLVQRAVVLPKKKLPVLAVYPPCVPVNTAPFMMQYWENASGQKGWMEDHTVLRGSRMYQPGDPWKQINWRMAAREQGIQVNLYESIQPGLVHMILDGESFVGKKEELELTLSIMGSLLTQLAQRKLQLYLTISKSGYFPAMTLNAAEGEEGLRGMLYHLAGFTCSAQPKANTKPGPSVFPDHLRKDGSIWLFTASGEQLPHQLLDRMSDARLRIVAAGDAEAAGRAGFVSYGLEQFRAQ